MLDTTLYGKLPRHFYVVCEWTYIPRVEDVEDCPEFETEFATRYQSDAEEMVLALFQEWQYEQWVYLFHFHGAFAADRLLEDKFCPYFIKEIHLSGE